MRAPRAFTLIEVVVVIGIIVLLAGLVLSVTVVVMEGSEIRQTEQTMKLLNQAVLEWEAETSRKLSWGEDGVPPNSLYDMQWNTPPIFRITELLNTVARPAGAKAIVAQIDPEMTHTYRMGEPPPWVVREGEVGVMDTIWAADAGTGSLGMAVLDAWGEPIMVVHPGRVRDTFAFESDLDHEPDTDGTVRVDAIRFDGTENTYGIARNRQVLFVSAGPDGQFGSLDPAAQETERRWAEDNVHSYQPERIPEP